MNTNVPNTPPTQSPPARTRTEIAADFALTAEHLNKLLLEISLRHDVSVYVAMYRASDKGPAAFVFRMHEVVASNVQKPDAYGVEWQVASEGAAPPVVASPPKAPKP